ncbi:MAG: hypothetical protein LBH64_05010, partial [Coriobacteriales bacterium]|nr:hypothetical protein [Coriobacteriales bacterium]
MNARHPRPPIIVKPAAPRVVKPAAPKVIEPASSHPIRLAFTLLLAVLLLAVTGTINSASARQNEDSPASSPVLIAAASPQASAQVKEREEVVYALLSPEGAPQSAYV